MVDSSGETSLPRAITIAASVLPLVRIDINTSFSRIQVTVAVLPSLWYSTSDMAGVIISPARYTPEPILYGSSRTRKSVAATAQQPVTVARTGTRRLPYSARANQHNPAPRAISRAAAGNETLQPKKRHSDVDGKKDADDRPDGIGRIYRTDAPFSMAFPDQDKRDERQRQKGQKPHADLHMGEVPYGTGNAFDAPVYPQAAERQAEKEDAEHQFE